MDKLTKTFLTLVICTIMLIILLVCSLSSSYLTTNYFLKAVNKTFDTNIKASKIKISFIDSYIDIENLSIYKPGCKFYIHHVKKINLKIDFYKLFQGDLKIDNLFVKNANIDVNLDEDIQRVKTQSELCKFILSKRTKFFTTHKYSINNINLKNISLKVTSKRNYRLKIQDADIAIPQISPNSIINCKADNFKVDIQSQDHIEISTDQSSMNSKILLAGLTQPQYISTDLTLNNITVAAKRERNQISKLNIQTELNCDRDTIKIETVNIREFDNNNSLISNVNLNGKYDKTTSNYDLAVKVIPLSNKLSNVITNYLSGNDINLSFLSFSGEISGNRSKVKSSGNAVLQHLETLKGSQTEKNALNSKLSYSLQYNNSKQSLKINKFFFDVFNEDSDKLISLNLKKSLDFTIENNNLKIKPKNYSIYGSINDLKISRIEKLLPVNLPPLFKKISGTINSELNITGSTANDIKINFTSVVKKLTVKTPDYIKIENLDFSVDSDLKLNNLNDLSLKINHFKITESDNTILHGLANCSLNFNTGQSNLSFKLDNINNNILDFIIWPGLKYTSILDCLKENNDYKIAIQGNAKSKDISKKQIVLNSFNCKIDTHEQNVITASLNTPLDISTDIKNNPLLGKVDASANITGLNLTDLNPLLDNQKINFSEGTLNGALNIISCKNLAENQIKGKLDIKNATGSYGGKAVNHIDSVSDFSATIKNNEISLDNLCLSSSYQNLDALKLQCCGSYSIPLKSFNISIKDLSLNYSAINQAMDSVLSKYTFLESLKLKGNFDASSETQKHLIKISTDLKCSDITVKKNNKHKPQILDGTIVADFKYTPHQLTILRNNVELNNSRHCLGKIASSGTISIPTVINKTYLKILATDIKLKEIYQLYNDFPGKINIDLSAIDFNLDLTGENITYDKNFKLDIHSNISKEQSNYSIRPIIAKLNNGNIFAALDYNDEKHLNDSFNFFCKITELPIKPFLQLYNYEKYNNSTGKISEASIQLAAKDFTNTNLREKLTGQVGAKVYNLGFNDNIEDFDLLRVVSLPFEVISQTEQLISDSAIPLFFRNLIDYSNKILNNQKRLKFASGSIFAKLNEKSVDIEDCTLVSKNSSFKSLKFTGSITLQESLNLYAKVNLNNFISIPLHITGQISAPNPDVISLTSFLKNTILLSLTKDSITFLKYPLKFIKSAMTDSADKVESVM